mmetsp:Transcript_3680/g.9349  ORF Transcript_3680/g.9349 Transcript_3680/m.9349 type:complete len:161 (+) Transcript_3680:213-695(+)
MAPLHVMPSPAAPRWLIGFLNGLLLCYHAQGETYIDIRQACPALENSSIVGYGKCGCNCDSGAGFGDRVNQVECNFGWKRSKSQTAEGCGVTYCCRRLFESCCEIDGLLVLSIIAFIALVILAWTKACCCGPCPCRFGFWRASAAVHPECARSSRTNDIA